MKKLFLPIFLLLAVSAVSAQSANLPGKQANAYALRRPASCDDFKRAKYTDRAAELKHPDSLVLPPGFPKPYPGSIQCGCLVSTSTVYYLSNEYYYRIFEYYSKKLTAAGFLVQQASTAAGTKDQVMRFSNAKSSGYIYAYADREAYSINYQVTDHSCHCNR